jgi:hypothetical protein
MRTIHYLPMAFLLSLICTGIAAQPYIKGGKKRHRFAQTVVGINMQMTNTGSSSFINAQSQVQAFKFNPQLFPRIYFSGTHFWGHTELYFSLPLGNVLKHKVNDLTYSFRQREVFGLKIYPWRIEHNKLRPFIGIATGGSDYHQYRDKGTNRGPVISTITFPLQAGMVYNRGKHLFELGASLNTRHRFDYYISKNQVTTINLPAVSYWLGFRWMLEGTAANEKNYYNGVTERRYKALLAKKKLNSYFFAVGPSVAFFTRRSPYNSAIKPWLGRKTESPAFPEFGAGYYFARIRSHISMAYRNYSTSLNAYGTYQKLSRSALSFEAHKYLFDYHGFVPFLGMSISNDKLRVKQTENGQPDFSSTTTKVLPGIIFGWDILPDKLQYMTLRTNLRYYPSVNAAMPDNRKTAFDQLEFNFIQLVLYPQRMKQIGK